MEKSVKIQKEYVITKDRLIDLLNELSKSKTIIAPVRNEFDDVLFIPVKDVGMIEFDYENTSNSVKEYFLPDSETLFSFTGETDHPSFSADKDPEEVLIFGLRSCDTTAVSLLDRFFRRDFEDDFYFQKRDSCLIISLACPQLWEDCFCNATRSGPILEGGFDFQLVPLNDRFLLQVGSDKADSLLDAMLPYLSQVTDKDKEDLSSLMDKIREDKPEFDLDKVYKNLKLDSVDYEIWQDIASRCQSCGWCLFICPTCSCFTVIDRQWPNGEQKRTRQWDSCYFMGFTRLAGGLNPVENKEEMVKRKYQHKFAQQVDEFGMSGCTGCGRCVKSCVGNVDWLENIIRME